MDSDTAAKLIGKTVTIAICTSDGTVYANSGVVAYDVPVALIEQNGFTLQLHFFHTAASYQAARLILWAGLSISVKWIALYEGSYTAETLPPYVPKGYAAELAGCQYYANVIEISAYGRAGLCKTTQGENACIWMINTPPMRPGGVPSITMLEGTLDNLSVEFNQLVATGFSGFGVQSGNAHNILVNLSGNATANIAEPLRNRTTSTLKILISRDL